MAQRETAVGAVETVSQICDGPLNTPATAEVASGIDSPPYASDNNNDQTSFDANVLGSSFDHLFRAIGPPSEPPAAAAFGGNSDLTLPESAMPTIGYQEADKTFAPHSEDGSERFFVYGHEGDAFLQPFEVMKAASAAPPHEEGNFELTFYQGVEAPRPRVVRTKLAIPRNRGGGKRMNVEEDHQQEADAPKRQKTMDSTLDVEALIDRDLQELEGGSDHAAEKTFERILPLLDIVCGSILPATVRTAALRSVHDELTRSPPSETPLLMKILFEEKPDFMRSLAVLLSESDGEGTDILGMLAPIVEHGMKGGELDRKAKLDLFKMFKVLLKSENPETVTRTKALYARVLAIKEESSL